MLGAMSCRKSGVSKKVESAIMRSYIGFDLLEYRYSNNLETSEMWMFLLRKPRLFVVSGPSAGVMKEVARPVGLMKRQALSRLVWLKMSKKWTFWLLPRMSTCTTFTS